MKLDITPIPSNLFTYNAATKTFVAEASSLNGYNFYQRIYDDACDVGFLMQSTRTGKVVPFYFTAKLQELEEFDGELQGWRFVSNHYDAYGTYYVHIYND